MTSTQKMDDKLDKIAEDIYQIGKTDATLNAHDWKALKPGAMKALSALIEEQAKVTGETSDGYHTFNELYRYRMLYNALWLNEVYWAESQYGGKMRPVKSRRHSDGELCFGGDWFVVTVQLPSGQITNHYEIKDWGKFHIPEVEKAPEWDGHTPQEAARRMEATLRSEGEK